MKPLIGLYAGFAMLASAGGASAADYQSRSQGGPGGTPFTLRCAQGDYLVGLRARAGDFIDAVAPLCAHWDVKRRVFLEPGVGPMHGGSGGGQAEIRCQDSSALNALLVERAPNSYGNVALLVPACVTARDTARTTRRIGPEQFGTSIADRRDREAEPGVGSSTTVDYNWNVMPRCDAGDIAVGIYGAAGNYVDRIGLICAPSPARMVMLPGALNLPAKPAPIKADPRIVSRESLIGAPLAARRCRSGFVWREASPSDFVCVPPESRDRVRRENATARSRVNPNGPYGAQSCAAGFVWRQAFDGDLVCVTPDVRALVRRENELAASRTVQ